MVPDDEQLAERPARLTHVIYNAALGHVRVRSEDAPATTVEVPPGDVRFRRVVGASEPEAALWLDSAECTALVRLLEYALSSLRIAPAYQPTLAALQAKVAELAALTTVASPADDQTAPAPEPLVLAPEPVAEAAPAAPAQRATTPAGRRSGRRGGRSSSKATAPPVPSSPPPALPAEVAAEVEEAASAALNGITMTAAAALPTESATAVAAEHTAVPRTFGEVWRDLRLLGERHPRLHALAGQVTSEVREVAEDGIWVYSHGIGRTYCVQREQLEAAWKALTAAGRLVARDLGLSQGAVTLLAHLPYVEYSAQPLTLHYPAQTPHELGTIQRRDIGA